MPEFPVEMHLFMAIKERVKVAHLIERVELHEKKSNSKINWFQRAARECDMIVDDPKMYPFSNHCAYCFVVSMKILS